MIGSRHQVSINSKRWASRTASQELLQQEWKEPDQTSDLASHKLKNYSSSNGMIGDLTANKFKLIAKRLKNGSNPTAVAPNRAKQWAEDIRNRVPQASRSVIELPPGRFELPSEPILLPAAELDSNFNQPHNVNPGSPCELP